MNLGAKIPGRRPHRMHGGFTLIELIVVLTIIGITAAVAFPTLSSLQNTRSAAAARLLLRDLTYAREFAAATGTRTWVNVSLGSNAYTMLVESVATPGRAYANVMSDPTSGLPFKQPLNNNEFAHVSLASVTLDSGAEVGFDWQGRPLNSSEAPLVNQGVILLTSGHGVTIEPNTGCIKYVAP